MSDTKGRLDEEVMRALRSHGRDVEAKILELCEQQRQEQSAQKRREEPSPVVAALDALIHALDSIQIYREQLTEIRLMLYLKPDAHHREVIERLAKIARHDTRIFVPDKSR